MPTSNAGPIRQFTQAATAPARAALRGLAQPADENVWSARLKGFVGGAGEGLLDLLTPSETDVMPDPAPGAGPAINALEGPVASLVSIFKNKAAREAATEEFLETAQGLGDTIYSGALDFAQNYPRVAAHTRLRLDPGMDGLYAAQAELPYGKINEPVNVSFSNEGRLSANRDLQDARNILYHEGMHVAQGLGNSQTRALYDAANTVNSQIRGNKWDGYTSQPFEMTAVRRGEAAGKGQLGRLNPEKYPSNAPEYNLQRRTPALDRNEKALAEAADAPAEHRLLLQDIQKRLVKEAGSQPYGAVEGLKRIIKPAASHVGYVPQSVDDARWKIEQILRERGNIK